MADAKLKKLETTMLGNTGLKVARLGAGGHFTNGPLAHEDIPKRINGITAAGRTKRHFAG